jgi:hypothetical protein
MCERTYPNPGNPISETTRADGYEGQRHAPCGRCHQQACPINEPTPLYTMLTSSTATYSSASWRILLRDSKRHAGRSHMTSATGAEAWAETTATRTALTASRWAASCVRGTLGTRAETCRQQFDTRNRRTRGRWKGWPRSRVRARLASATWLGTRHCRWSRQRP